MIDLLTDDEVATLEQDGNFRKLVVAIGVLQHQMNQLDKDHGWYLMNERRINHSFGALKRSLIEYGIRLNEYEYPTLAMQWFDTYVLARNVKVYDEAIEYELNRFKGNAVKYYGIFKEFTQMAPDSTEYEQAMVEMFNLFTKLKNDRPMVEHLGAVEITVNDEQYAEALFTYVRTLEEIESMCGGQLLSL